jgi:hypothetical protein
MEGPGKSATLAANQVQNIENTILSTEKQYGTVVNVVYAHDVTILFSPCRPSDFHAHRVEVYCLIAPIVTRNLSRACPISKRDR